jgi:predicted transporter
MNRKQLIGAGIYLLRYLEISKRDVAYRQEYVLSTWIANR